MSVDTVYSVGELVEVLVELVVLPMRGSGKINWLASIAISVWNSKVFCQVKRWVQGVSAGKTQSITKE